MYVPITMQTVCIVLLSLIHTPKVVVSSVLGWIGLAAVGVPVFADMDVGMILLAGTTGGYIVSFPIAACFISYVASKRWVKSYFDLACTLFVASSIVYTLGVSWLSTFIGLKAAVFHGFLMCIPGGLFKTMVIVSFVRKYKLLNSVR
jgi:biotin transporter BioY